MILAGDVHRGMRIVGADGHRLGRVLGVEAGRVRAARGFLVRRHFELPLSEVERIAGRELVVSRRREGLGMTPGALEQARMDSAKFQEHGQYDVSEKAHHRADELEDARMRGPHGRH